MLIIGTERYDKTNANTLTRAFLQQKGAATKTQLAKHSLQDDAQRWASDNREMRYDDWVAFGKALRNPQAVDQRILDKESEISWYPAAANPNWRGRPALPFDILTFVLDYLDDRSLASAQGVNKQWARAADEVMLPSSQYQAVTAEGKRETLALTPPAHRQLALDTFRRAKRAEGVVLYRQRDKKAFLTEEEIGKYTVSSFPWTPEKTAAWILGGIQSRKTFILVTNLTSDNLTPDKEYGIPVLSREVTQLLLSGYTPREDRLDTFLSGKSLKNLVGKRILVFSPSKDNDTHARLAWRDVWDRAAKSLKVAYPNNVVKIDEITSDTLPDVVEKMLHWSS